MPVSLLLPGIIWWEADSVINTIRRWQKNALLVSLVKMPGLERRKRLSVNAGNANKQG
jgi:hypothetical protein